LSEVTTLRFSRHHAVAARHLIANTSLDYLQPYPIASLTEEDGSLVVCYGDTWRFSSGERALLNVLAYLRYPPSEAYDADLTRVDSQTAAVVRESVALANGARV
jgi:hypothetical protein